jgi:hypothetical protein
VSYVLAAKGLRASDLRRKAAVASNPALRHEESAWLAAAASKNRAAQFQEDVVMVNTCHRLGLGWDTVPYRISYGCQGAFWRRW